MAQGSSFGKATAMKHDGFSYVVRAELVFTPKEVAVLKKCSESHYDHTCKAASKLGGLIFGMESWVTMNPEDTPVPQPYTSRDLNLLLKVCEMAPAMGVLEGPALSMKLKIVFDRVQDEQKRLQAFREAGLPQPQEVEL